MIEFICGIAFTLSVTALTGLIVAWRKYSPLVQAVSSHNTQITSIATQHKDLVDAVSHVTSTHKMFDERLVEINSKITQLSFKVGK